MPRPKKDSHQIQSVRDKLLEATEQMLFERGYMGLSLEEIAQQAGIRKASLYYHFRGGKEEMVMAVAMLVTRRYEQAILQVIRDGKDLRGQLIGVIRMYAEVQRPLERIVRDAVRFVSEDHQNEAKQAFFQHGYGHIHAMFEEAVKAGEAAPHDTRLSTWMFLALCSEMSGLVPQLMPLSSLEQTVDLFLGGIEAKRVPKPKRPRGRTV